jgi:hypothetical protein
MRWALLLGMALFVAGATAAGSSKDLPGRQQIERLGWLSGCWEGVAGQVRFEEQWMRPLGGLLLGMGRTTRGDSVVSHEAMSIEEREGRLVFRAQPSRQPPAEFAQQELTDGKVAFTNPEHDFPKWISYQRLSSDSIVAQISGESAGQKIDAEFRLGSVACPGGR